MNKGVGVFLMIMIIALTFCGGYILGEMNFTIDSLSAIDSYFYEKPKRPATPSQPRIVPTISPGECYTLKSEFRRSRETVIQVLEVGNQEVLFCFYIDGGFRKEIDQVVHKSSFHDILMKIDCPQ